MMEDKQAEYQEFDDFQDLPKSKANKRNFLKEIVDGSILTNDFFVAQLPFIFFLTALGIVYIGNSYHAEKMVRQTKQLELELKRLQPEAIAISSELMQQSNQSQVANLLKSKNLELIESREPPIKIVVNKEPFE
ncbi:MAG: FtsL-like putative cell division protein [Salinivirgaceae bacterium]|jgi:cell division protein FtsL